LEDGTASTARTMGSQFPISTLITETASAGEVPGLFQSPEDNDGSDMYITPPHVALKDEDDALDAMVTDTRRKSTEKAMLDATLTNLRSKLSDIEKDNWMYEKPRYTYS
jgi:hypothetical protein